MITRARADRFNGDGTLTLQGPATCRVQPCSRKVENNDFGFALFPLAVSLTRPFAPIVRELFNRETELRIVGEKRDYRLSRIRTLVFGRFS